jgi:branched-chain amino acid transport system substrate-binding protein
VTAWIGSSAERRHRFFGLLPVATKSVNARFVMHFNEGATWLATMADGPNSSYDAFYLAAYATYALGDKPATGEELARSIPRLLPPGTPIDVGPAAIFDAFSTLRRGENIDLNGAFGSLDLDPTTGESPFQQALECIEIDDHGAAVRSADSGIVYSSQTGRVEGVMHCP